MSLFEAILFLAVGLIHFQAVQSSTFVVLLKVPIFSTNLFVQGRLTLPDQSPPLDNVDNIRQPCVIEIITEPHIELKSEDGGFLKDKNVEIIYGLKLEDMNLSVLDSAEAAYKSGTEFGPDNILPLSMSVFQNRNVTIESNAHGVVKFKISLINPDNGKMIKLTYNSEKGNIDLFTWRDHQFINTEIINYPYLVWGQQKKNTEDSVYKREGNKWLLRTDRQEITAYLGRNGTVISGVPILLDGYSVAFPGIGIIQTRLPPPPPQPASRLLPPPPPPQPIRDDNVKSLEDDKTLGAKGDKD